MPNIFFGLSLFIFMVIELRETAKIAQDLGSQIRGKIFAKGISYTFVELMDGTKIKIPNGDIVSVVINKDGNEGISKI